MIISVFVFAFLGLEHSVANTVLFTIVGLTHGIDVLPALGNVAVALLGNFVGGGLLIGAYYAYANDDSRWLRSQPHQNEGASGRLAECCGLVGLWRSSESESPTVAGAHVAGGGELGLHPVDLDDPRDEDWSKVSPLS